jgi:hypothetical protein
LPPQSSSAQKLGRLLTENHVFLIRAGFALLCGIALMQYLLTDTKSSNVLRPSTNSFVLANNTPLHDVMRVPLYKAIDLDGIRSEQVEAMRAKVLQPYAKMLSGPYRLSKAVFGNVTWSAPWLSVLDLYYFGKDRPPGTNMVTKSAASASVLNPLLLVRLNFWGFSIWDPKERFLWNREKITAWDLEKDDFPFTPAASKLIWDPFHRSAEVTYDITAYAKALVQHAAPDHAPPADDIPFGVSALNARDFNLNYVMLDAARSTNINAPGDLKPVLLTDRLEWFEFPWLGGRKLNYEGYPIPDYSKLTWKALPAKVVLNLWSAEPEKPTDTADLTFTVNIE